MAATRPAHRLNIPLRGVLSLACLLFAGGCTAKSGRHIEKYRSGQTKIDCVYSNGVLHGQYTEWYESGIKKMTVLYVVGNMEGISRTWETKGRLSAEVPMSNGFAHGDARFYLYKPPVTIRFDMGRAPHADTNDLVYRNGRPWEGTERIYPWENQPISAEKRKIIDSGGPVDFVNPDFSRYELRTYSQGRPISIKQVDEDAKYRLSWWQKVLLWSD